jgi:hypothetical protein
MRKRARLWVGALIALAGTLYCAAGTFQESWLTVVPGYPVDRATAWARVYMIAALVCLFLLALFALLLWRSRDRRDR